jgi:hypothetical protein
MKRKPVAGFFGYIQYSKVASPTGSTRSRNLHTGPRKQAHQSLAEVESCPGSGQASAGSRCGIQCFSATGRWVSIKKSSENRLIEISGT